MTNPLVNHPLALLNTTIATADGLFDVRTITLDEARAMVRAAGSLDSAIGHQSTADVMSTLLGIEVPMNRQQFLQKPGQHALVFKLKSRPPEGQVLTAQEIESIGYEFKVMTRAKYLPEAPLY